MSRNKVWKVQTKKSALMECLQYLDGKRASASKGGRGMEAIRGMEDIFNEYDQKCHIIRDLLQAMETQPVREVLAQWAIDRMLPENPERDRKWQQVIEDEDARGIREPLKFDEGGPDI